MKSLPVAVGVIKNPQGQILISKRHDKLHQGGFWEFPGGKIEAGETVQEALARELKEELDIEAHSSTPLITLTHHYPDLTVTLYVQTVEAFSGEPRGCEGQPLRWVYPHELNRAEFPAANGAIITALQLPPFYAILDDSEADLLLPNLETILARGVKLIQARLKHLSREKAGEFLTQAMPLCRQQYAQLLINSDVEDASSFKVDGIHLTSRHLLALSKRPEAPQGVNPEKYWVAASCHTLAELRHAEKMGVDFAVLAPVLTTQTHPDTPALGWARFAELVAEAGFPVYALGGVSMLEVDTARLAGAQGIAGIRAFLR